MFRICDSGFRRLLRTDVPADKETGQEGSEAAGDLFRIEAFQQRAVGDVGGDDGGQLCAQTVVHLKSTSSIAGTA